MVYFFEKDVKVTDVFFQTKKYQNAHNFLRSWLDNGNTHTLCRYPDLGILKRVIYL